VAGVAPGVARHAFSTPFSEGVQSFPTFKPWAGFDDAGHVFFASVQGYGHKGPAGVEGWVYPGSGGTADSKPPGEGDDAGPGTPPGEGEGEGEGVPPAPPAAGDPPPVIIPEDPDGEFAPDPAVPAADLPSRTGPRIINVGIPGPGADPPRWRRAWRDKVLPALAVFAPDLVLVSAGFDAHRKDDINFAYCGITERDYTWVTEAIVAVANMSCPGRVVSVLEGGYRIQGGPVSAFARSVAAHVRALAEATGRSDARVKADLAESGDLGRVAFAARATQRTMFAPATLTIRSVFAAFRSIAASAGTGAQDRKRGAIVKLLAAARGHEAGYVIRALQGKLRIGLAEQTVLTSLAHAAELAHGGSGGGGGKKAPPSSRASSSSIAAAAARAAALANRLEAAAQAVKRAYCECPSYDVLIPALLAAPPASLPDTVAFTVGVPVRPMLAKPTTGVSEVLDRAAAAAGGAGDGLLAEYKYDGERAQVHVRPPGCGGGGGAAPRVAIYSRNSEDNTSKFPDVAAAVLAGLAPGVTSLVLDAEVVAIDRAAGKLLPFQVLASRKRVADPANPGGPVALFAFDCLHRNGETLLNRPLAERRAALAASLATTPGVLELAVGSATRDPEALAAFLDEAVAAGTEGLIVKGLASTYEPSRRSTHWLKLKKDYLDGVGDTFDVVPIGAWHGRGKRRGVYGAYLLAVWDDETEEFQTISKIGTGFSEEALEALSTGLAPYVIAGPRPYYVWGEACAPDVWFEPAAVWEVKAADLSLSPVHRAAAGKADPARGVSIRFPRLVRVREDKAPEQATTAEQVAEMYARQVTVTAQQQQQQQQKEGGDDFY
jgi:DNA ligase-1